MKARILIVEDERIVQFDLGRRLERLGHSIVGLASRGEEAVAKAAELAPDLVLMDVRLEGPMDGIQAARQIRATRQIPIVYLTAFTGTFPETAPSGPLYPCLSKPFREEELQAAIAQALEHLQREQT